MRKVITMLFAAALLSTAYVAVAAKAEPLDKSTQPNPDSNSSTETINQKPDDASGQSMDSNSDMSSSGSSGSSDMGNDTTDPNTEKLRQEPK